MMSPPSVAHIVTSIEDRAAGPSYSVTRLAEEQVAQDIPAQILSLSSTPGQQHIGNVPRQSFARSYKQFPLLNRLEFSTAMEDAVMAAAQNGVIMHVHGLWRMPNVYPGVAAAKYGTPLILTPRGMLGDAALNYSKTQKALFWWLFQKRALKHVTCFHATSQAELEDIRAYGLNGPVAIIPNGIDVPTQLKPEKREKEILSLGRIHPKKGLRNLLLAWAQIRDHLPDWRVRIVGPSEIGHLEELKLLAGTLNLGDSVIFDAPLFGDEKRKAYARASIFVLPTQHENFGLVVGEALAQETPVVCTYGAPWSGLNTYDCGWWIDHGAAPLAKALKDAASATEDRRRAMGLRGRDWMLQEFAWDAIAQKTSDLYAWCSGGLDTPEFVKF